MDNARRPHTVRNLVAERISVCRQCPYLQGRLNRCAVCGCFVLIKARIQSAQCPIGRWPK